MQMFLKELVFRLRLYLNGIRFYDAERLDKAELAQEIKVNLFGHKDSTIQLYRMVCVDMVLKKGVVTPDQYTSYVVKIVSEKSDDEMSDAERLMCEQLYFINGRFNRISDSSRAVEILLDVIVDVLKGHAKSY